MNFPFTYNKADWIEVLEVIYDTQMRLVDTDLDYESSGAISPEELEKLKTLRSKRSIIKQQSDISSEELENAIDYLREAGLVHKDSISLTESGFRLIHHTKMRRQQQKTNFILTVLTVVLVVLTGVLIGVEVSGLQL